MKTLTATGLAGALALSTAAGIAAAQAQGEAQFQDWRGQHEEDAAFQIETWAATTTGHLIERTGAVPDGFRAWLSVDCNVPAFTFAALKPRLNEYSLKMFFTHAVTTAKGDGRPKPTADGYVGKTWLVRLDSDHAEWMGFADLWALFRIPLPRTIGPGFTQLSPSNEGVHPEMRAKFNRWSAWWRKWLSSEEGRGVDSRLLNEEANRRRAETTREIEDVRTLSLDDLKRAKRLRIEVGIRPEDRATDIELTNDNASAGTAVVEFSLKGSARAIEWTERNCREANARLLEESGQG